MEFKKGDEYQVKFSTTRFDYDDDGNVIGFEDGERFNMYIDVYNKDKNLINSSTIYTEWDLDTVIDMDLEDEMKTCIEDFARDSDIEKYSLNDINFDYNENQGRATFVIE